METKQQQLREGREKKKGLQYDKFSVYKSQGGMINTVN